MKYPVYWSPCAAEAARSNRNSHSNKDLPVLLAGGRFQHGQHLAFARVSTRLCNLYVNVLNELGFEDRSFGTSTGTLKGLELA